MPSADEWILSLAGSVENLAECAAAICEVWPRAVLEDTAAGEFAYCVDSLLPAQRSEICVYRDLEVARLWQKGASGERLHNTMIQANLTPQGIQLITDDWRDPLLAGVVARLKTWRNCVSASH